MQKRNYALQVYLVLLTIFATALSSPVKAQENILSDISYLYMEKLIASAKENYPRLKNFKSQVSSAKIDVSTAKTSWLDPFSFQFVSRSNQVNTNSVNLTTADLLNGYQFGVSLNLGELLSKPTQVKKAKEQVKIAEFNQQEYNLQLETEVKTRYFNYLQYKNSLSLVTNAFLDAENNFQVIKLKYQKAEVTLEQYNSASMMYSQSGISKLSAETNYLTAKAALEELTVKKLEEIK